MKQTTNEKVKTASLVVCFCIKMVLNKEAQKSKWTQKREIIE